MDTGWIKIYRSMLKWGWYTDVPVKALFIHILLSANYEPGNFLGREIKRGQLVTGLQNISQQTGLTVQQTRTALKKLQSTGEITVESTNKYTLITVVNYERFQDSSADYQQTNNKPSTNEQQTNNKQATNEQQTINNNIRNKEYKKNKKERNIFTKPTLDEVTSYIEENMYCVKPDAFFDYYEANGWKISGRPMKDWKATVRNWDRREQEKKKPSNKYEGWSF